MSAIHVDVATSPPCRVHVGRGALELAREAFARARPPIVVSDERVWSLHGTKLDPDQRARPLLLPRGEAAKDFDGLRRTLDFLATQGVDRRGVVWTMGGGAVLDVGGLAAGMYMRGVDVVHAPTTLLAQVDAAIGGKTAINLEAGKNLAGVFHFPREVHADTSTLETLDAEEYASGLGEVVKTAMIEGGEAWLRVETAVAALRARDADLLADIVAACVRTKARIVAADPREAGPRRALNLGHSFAHAIERSAGYGRVPHGVAVAAGLGLALRASRELGILVDRGLVERAARVLAALDLPTDLADLRRRFGLPLPCAELVAAMRLDKKNRAGEIHLVLPRGLGDLDLEVAVDAALVASWLA